MKTSALDRAIVQLEAEIQVLEHALEKLRSVKAQAKPKAARTRSQNRPDVATVVAKERA